MKDLLSVWAEQPEAIMNPDSVGVPANGTADAPGRPGSLSRAATQSIVQLVRSLKMQRDQTKASAHQCICGKR